MLILLVVALRWLIDGPAWMWQAALVLLPIGLALAVDRARQLGHRLVDGWLVTQQGSLVRRRSMLATDGIIGWNVNRSFFQRRAGLATLTATTAAGRQGYGVQDVALAEALGIATAGVPGLLEPFLQGHPGDTNGGDGTSAGSASPPPVPAQA
jgi:putative membrane protein